ncbi:hypothetical protein JK358_37340 [Nocardia sp. 2]|uniref:DUF8175 domain-containing protein n=1 Tax=Nocardia acididurans TaxID=2802282 RepID=A0ABS1MHN8_9NOCA|nr:hypothetical protein [Nocardia acididurans]MBL1080077.1 hypothetical protein [Nocardia acididurans]
MTTPEPDNGRGSVSLIAAIALLVLILIGSLVAWLTTRDSGENTATAPSTSVTAPNTATPQGFAAPDVDAFGRRVDIPNNPAGQPLAQTRAPLTATDPGWLTAAPVLPETGGWQRVYGASVPFSTSDGPTAIVDGIPTGYSHTPQGAALAAVYVTWQSYARPGDWPLRERMQVMTEQDRDTFFRLDAAGKIPDFAAESATKWLVAPDAFRIDSWSATGDLCVLRLATKASAVNGAPRWLASQVVMVWDGQWRLQLAADQELPKSEIDSLSGWSTW